MVSIHRHARRPAIERIRRGYQTHHGEHGIRPVEVNRLRAGNMQDDPGMQEKCAERRRADRVRSGPGQKEATPPLADLTEIAPEQSHTATTTRNGRELIKRTISTTITVIQLPWMVCRRPDNFGPPRLSSGRSEAFERSILLISRERRPFHSNR